MLTREDNEILVRVSKGTPCGDFMRLFWIPFMLSSDLRSDGPSLRIKLLGEDLIAFRDTSGLVGLVDHACPHRGAPMFYARNEEGGLRCLYHGWKFDVAGRALELPAEPEGSRMKDQTCIKAYACRERNGVVWTYMGPDRSNPPPLPALEWNMVPSDQVHLSLRVQECNWMQALEGEIDSAHAPFLHSKLNPTGLLGKIFASRDLRPTFEVHRQDFGVSIGARRKSGEDQAYWRVNQFVLPFYTLVPPTFPQLSGHAWVPIDDHHTLAFMFSYHPSEPITEKARTLFHEGHHGRETGHASRHAFRSPDSTKPYAAYWPNYSRENDFGFDYESQQTTWFSGMPGLWIEDAACQSGAGGIADRTRERLGVSDSGIVATRRALLDSIKEHMSSGERPRMVGSPELSMVRAISLELPAGVSWTSEEGQRQMKAEVGQTFKYTNAIKE